jgi:hypothetical protein
MYSLTPQQKAQPLMRIVVLGANGELGSKVTGVGL